MERVDDRIRTAERTADVAEWERSHDRFSEPHAFEFADDESVDLEGFPVMVRLSQVQSQIGYLTQTVERFSQTLERVERGLADGTLGPRGGWRSMDALAPTGITARANPMTHPLTPISTRTELGGRDETLAGVRALFQPRSRPWWQRLPEILRG